MASYAFAGNSGAIGCSTLKPYILLMARECFAVPKPHTLLPARDSELDTLLPARGSPAIAKPHILLPVCRCFANSNRFEFDEKDIASEERLRDLYERWTIHHSISRSPYEKHKRFEVFKQNATYIHNSNKLDIKPYKLGLNKCGDITRDEAAELMQAFQSFHVAM